MSKNGYMSLLIAAGNIFLFVSSTAIPEDLKREIGQNLEGNSSFADKKSIIINVLEGAKIFDRFEVRNYVGSGTGGVVFGVLEKGTPGQDLDFVAKVIIDNDETFPFCEDNQVLRELEQRKVPYVNRLISNDTYTGTVDGKEFYACVLILEYCFTDLDRGNIFPVESKKNWPILFRFFGKLILSFTEIHFVGRILHGDVKPDNIMVRINKEEKDIEPVVIDFDLMLKIEGKEGRSDSQLRYSEDYRPPEIDEATSVDGEASQENWDDNWERYRFSKDFKEDVYALGATIKTVLRSQKRNVQKDSKRYSELQNLVDKMTRPRRSRPNMIKVLERFTRVLRSCSSGKDDPNDALFLQKSDETLRTLRDTVSDSN